MRVLLPVLWALLLLLSPAARAQQITWSAPVQVAPPSEDNVRPRIVLDASGNPMITWGNEQMVGMGMAMFSRWNGNSFTSAVTLSPMTMSVFTYSWAGPEIASRGDTVYVVFKNLPEDTGRIYIVRSYDAGQSWQGPTPVDGNLGNNNSRFHTISVLPDGNPVVAFMRFKPVFQEPRYVVVRSSDYGATFGTPVLASRSSTEACDCCPASMAVSGSTVMLFYRNNEADVRTIWTQTSTDGGNTFPDSLEADNTNWMINACPSSGPDAIIIGDTAYAVFRSSPVATRVYLSRSAISSQQLAQCVQHTGGFAGLQQQEYPAIAHHGNTAALVWRELVTGAYRLCFSFTENISNGFPTAYDTLASNGVRVADVAMDGNNIHVVWEDITTNTVMYRKGSYTLSVPTGAAVATAVQLHPNPASHYFAVSGMEHIVDCTLTNDAGHTWQARPAQGYGDGYFSLQGVAAGVYTVRVADSRGRAATA
ncbi:MAG: exo-alpha-sialidase, partial [Flavipsychrobacter sp.]|nr:exo-alpha-sialidase [Flavipsychrobacter sp.]